MRQENQLHRVEEEEVHQIVNIFIKDTFYSIATAYDSVIMDIPKVKENGSFGSSWHSEERGHDDELLGNNDSKLSPPDICIHNAVTDDEEDLTSYETDPGFYGGQTSDESDFENDHEKSKDEMMMKDSKLQKFFKKHWGWNNRNNCALKKRKKDGYATDTFLQEKCLSEINLRECPREKRSDSIMDNLFCSKKSAQHGTDDDNSLAVGKEESASRRGSIQEV